MVRDERYTYAEEIGVIDTEKDIVFHNLQEIADLLNEQEQEILRLKRLYECNRV